MLLTSNVIVQFECEHPKSMWNAGATIGNWKQTSY